MSARDTYISQLTDWSDIQDHLQMLHGAARGNVLEIGVRMGMSTSALLAGVEEHGGHVYSMDINDCRVFAGHPQWTFVQANSQEVTPFPEIESFDVALVDGDHSYEGALHDIRACRAARIFVHDTDAPDYPGVRKAVEEFVSETGRTVTFHQGSYGMAEII